MLANCIRALSTPLTLCTRSAMCEERERDTEREREKKKSSRFRKPCRESGWECFGRVRVREDCCWGGALERSAVFCQLRFFWFWFWFSWLEIVEIRYGKVVWILTMNSRKERGRERHMQTISTREEIEQYAVVYGTLGTTFHLKKSECRNPSFGLRPRQGGCKVRA